MSEQRRDFGPQASQMRDALERYSREELIDLLTHILRLYVIEAPDGVTEEVVSVPEPTLQLHDLSFPQLILHLQMNLAHAELQHLKVSGNRVWVERDGAEVLLTEADDPAESAETYPDAAEIEPRRAPAPARPAPEPPVDGPIFGEEAPARSVGSFRSREPAPQGPSATAAEAGRIQRPSVALRDEVASPPPRSAPAMPNWRDELQSSPPARPAPGRKAKEPDEDEPRDTSERFSMLELD